MRTATDNERSEAGGWSAASCSLTAFLTLTFVGVGLAAVIAIGGLALWLPIEIKQDGETIKERNDLNFKANRRSVARREAAL